MTTPLTERTGASLGDAWHQSQGLSHQLPGARRCAVNSDLSRSIGGTRQDRAGGSANINVMVNDLLEAWHPADIVTAMGAASAFFESWLIRKDYDFGIPISLRSVRRWSPVSPERYN